MSLRKYVVSAAKKTLRRNYSRRGSNPVPPSSQFGVSRFARDERERAGNLYRQFTGHDSIDVARVPALKPPKTVLAIGKLDFVGYTTVRDGEVEKYIHRFRASSAPILCASPDGSQLWIVGGDYEFTDRGIVDR